MAAASAIVDTAESPSADLKRLVECLFGPDWHEVSIEEQAWLMHELSTSCGCCEECLGLANTIATSAINRGVPFVGDGQHRLLQFAWHSSRTIALALAQRERACIGSSPIPPAVSDTDLTRISESSVWATCQHETAKRLTGADCKCRSSLSGSAAQSSLQCALVTAPALLLFHWSASDSSRPDAMIPSCDMMRMPLLFAAACESRDMNTIYRVFEQMEHAASSHETVANSSDWNLEVWAKASPYHGACLHAAAARDCGRRGRSADQGTHRALAGQDGQVGRLADAVGEGLQMLSQAPPLHATPTEPEAFKQAVASVCIAKLFGVADQDFLDAEWPGRQWFCAYELAPLKDLAASGFDGLSGRFVASLCERAPDDSAPVAVKLLTAHTHDVTAVPPYPGDDTAVPPHPHNVRSQLPAGFAVAAGKSVAGKDAESDAKAGVPNTFGVAGAKSGVEYCGDLPHEPSWRTWQIGATRGTTGPCSSSIASARPLAGVQALDMDDLRQSMSQPGVGVDRALEALKVAHGAFYRDAAEAGHLLENRDMPSGSSSTSSTSSATSSTSSTASTIPPKAFPDFPSSVDGHSPAAQPVSQFKRPQSSKFAADTPDRMAKANSDPDADACEDVHEPRPEPGCVGSCQLLLSLLVVVSAVIAVPISVHSLGHNETTQSLPSTATAFVEPASPQDPPHPVFEATEPSYVHELDLGQYAQLTLLAVFGVFAIFCLGACMSQTPMLGSFASYVVKLLLRRRPAMMIQWIGGTAVTDWSIGDVRHEILHTDGSCGRGLRLIGGGGRVVSTGLSGKMIFIDIRDRPDGGGGGTWSRIVKRIQAHTADTYGLSVSPDESLLVTACEEGSVKLWTIHGDPVRTLREAPAGDTRVYSVCFSADGKRVFAAGYDEKALLEFDVDGVRAVRVMPADELLFAVDASADGQWVVATNTTGQVKIWNATTLVVTCTLEGAGRDWCRGARFSPDSRRVAVVSYDGHLRVWRTMDWSRTIDIEAHSRLTCQASWSADSKQIVTSSNDYKVKVWAASTGTLLRTMTGHTGITWGAEMSADGKTIFSTGEDETVRVWTHEE